MSRPVYIYALTEPGQEWNVRYVGKVTGRSESALPDRCIRSRLRKHINETKLKLYTRKANWIRRVLNLGHVPGWKLLDIGDLTTYQCLEQFYIRTYRESGFDLTNSTAGGDGTVGHKHSEATKLYLSKLNAGKVLSREQRLAISQGMKGRVMSPETRARMSTAKAGKKRKPFSQEWKDKIAQAGIGRKQSQTTIELRAAFHRGRKRSDETRRKISESRLGQPGWNKGLSTPAEVIEKTRQSRINNRKSYCKHGHELISENTYWTPAGHRTCRVCRLQRSKEHTDKRKLKRQALKTCVDGT